MATTDSSLIHTLIDEALSGAPGNNSLEEKGLALNQIKPDSQIKQTPEKSPAAVQKSNSNLPQEGSLRQTKVQKLLEIYSENKATGRLICDIGTIQSEVFFTKGEPVHAKSCHSISQGRDQIGNVALIDLLTWKDGSFKFQEGWPAASKTISHPLSMFLDGSVSTPESVNHTEAKAPEMIPSEARAFVSSPVQPDLSSQTISSVSQDKPQSNLSNHSPMPAEDKGLSQPIEETISSPVTEPAPQAIPQKTPPPSTKASQNSDFVINVDDFTIVDDLTANTYSEMIDSSGLIKLGMLLVLVRSEFVRFEKGLVPFCFASIGMDLPQGAKFSEAALGKIGERFEKVCQPLDIISYAGKDRFYAFFPQSDGYGATTTLKQFMNNVIAIPLDGKLHGSAVKIKIGLSEIPRDGTDFQRIFQHAAGLRGQATNEKKLVTSSF